MFGTTLRIYEKAAGRWNIVWHAVVSGQVHRLQGRLVGDEIIQEGTDSQGRPMRWIFSNIRPQRFRWRAETSHDGGRSWKLDTVMEATRRTL